MAHCSNKTSDVYILIVGETGVGKSTFVNAFANYINFKSLQHAVDCEDIISVIPSKFSIMDDSFETREIKFGESKNECGKPGSSSTIDARLYKIPYGDRSIILIDDTPGVGDTNGIESDEQNLQNLLAKIAEFEHLHAILILLKPNDSRVSVLFKYCIKQLLSSLEKSASLNIVFLFTNSRGTFYRPGDTVIPLRAVLKEIENSPPYVSVPFNKINTFCVDNEAFRFLIARKNNVNFSEEETREFGESWNRSAKETHKLLEYIDGLKPHNIKDTVSVNNSRTLIIRLSKPLAEISQNISDNVKRLDQYKKMRNDKSLSLQDLQARLVVKRIGLNIITLNKPVTVCGDKYCVTHYSNVNGASAVRYSQICHENCQLVGVQKEELGDARLTECWAMVKGTCRRSKCRHNYRTHMHIYYMSEPYEYQAEDELVSEEIKTNKEARADIDRKMAKINDSLKEYHAEQDSIQDAMAKFAHFIRHNAITPVNDAYKDYILYFIDLEKKMGADADKDKIRNYQRLIREYEERVNVLEQKLKDERLTKDMTSAVSSADVEELKNQLCSLRLYGQTIKKALEAQSEARYYDQIKIQDVKLPLGYIDGLKPHYIKDTVSVNTSCTLIIRLSKPLAEISQNISDNVKRLDQYKKMRNDKSLSLEDLQARLVVKRIGLNIITLNKRVTVCCDKDCVTYYSNVNGASAVRYSQICHENCQLVGVQKEELGDARLRECWAMMNGTCRRNACRHNYRTHMHIYYMSEPYEYQTQDESVSKDIKTNEQAQADIDSKMAKINDSLKEYHYEQDIIQDAMAKFAHFIRHNAITPVNDAYKDYILYLIDLEKKMGADADKIRNYQRLIREYEERVNVLEQKLKDERLTKDMTSAVSSADVEKLKNLLYSLPLYGQTIKKALEAQSEDRYYDQIKIQDVKLTKSRYETGKDWVISMVQKYIR